MSTDRLIYWRKKCPISIIRKVITRLIRFRGAIIPEDVVIGENVSFVHDGLGCVIHPRTIIGNNVKIFQGVTIGKKDVITNQRYKGKIYISDGVILCSGSQILAPDDLEFCIGENAVIAANAVVLSPVPSGEVWEGIPARRLK